MAKTRDLAGLGEGFIQAGAGAVQRTVGVRVVTANGTDAFDAGAVNISWE